MLDFVKRILTGRKREVYSADELRVAFKDRYRQFRLLLKANNRVLDIMAEIEEALKGTQPFGMAYVRERCIRASANVHQIIERLNKLAPGKYEALHDRFEDILQKINPHIDLGEIKHEGPVVLSLGEIDKELADQVGSKMANIGEVRNRIGLSVPNGFVITAAGYQRFMEHNQLQPEIHRRIRETDAEKLNELYELSTALQQIIMDAPIPADLETAIMKHYQALRQSEGENLAVAVRSSALGEDLHRSTFAGLYHSVLNVKGENILHTYKEVLASKYNLPAMTYRLSRGIRDEDVAMCVGCMSMIDAVSGGVLYTRNPIRIGDDSIVVDSMWGLPKSVVDGSVQADHFVISRGDPLQITQMGIPLKEHKYVCRPIEGICQMEVTGDEGEEPSITVKQALELARLAIWLEEYYQSPQDIEWCLNQDRSIIILQCRPLKQTDTSPQEVEHVG